MYYSVPWLTVASKINDFNLHSKNVLISHNCRNKAKEKYRSHKPQQFRDRSN